MRKLTAVTSVWALLLLGAACSSADQVEVTQPSPGTPEPTATAEPTEPPTATVAPTATPTAEATQSPTAAPEPTPTSPPAIPGEPFDYLVPLEGELVGVIAVEDGDILEVHELPGENSPLVGELPNLADDVEGTGDGRELPNSIWWRVRWNEIEGWVGSGFMARLGDTFDSTADVVAANGGVYPEASSMAELGSMVADLLESEDPPSVVVVVKAPTEGDLGETTLDIVGLGDDSVRGLRIHVFGDPTPGGFVLSNVETTLLCARGVSPDGLCV